MKETKCLEKYSDYFDDYNNHKNMDDFNTTLTSPTDYKHLYESFLNNKKTKISSFYSLEEIIQKDIKNLDHTINLVYEKLIESNNKKLLVVGQVQSGKTDFAIGLTSKIITNSFQSDQINIVINLTSNFKNIINQTYKRFNDFFKEIELDSHPNFYQYEDLNFLLRQERIIENDALFFLLKNKNHLDKLNDYLIWLSKSNQKFQITILDDEGDNASFNTNENRSENLSTINRQIQDLLNHNFDLISTNFVSVTATPLVHFFVNEENNLKPDFAFILKPGNSYTGVIEYNEQLNLSQSNVINEIASNDADKKEKNNSLERAIICYLTLCCWNQEKIFGNKNIKPRMMINMSVEKDNHENLKYEIDAWLREYQRRPELIERHLKNYDIWQLLNDNFDQKRKQQLIEAIKNLVTENKYEIIVLNSDNNEINQIQFDENETNRFQIIIGSMKLSRGLTIKNLICAYMSIRPSTGSKIDTLLQRARWFGYHKNYFQYMRIFLTSELINDFAVAAGIMDNLYKTIEEAQENNLDFKAIERYLPSQELKVDLSATNQRAKTRWESSTNLKNVFIRNKYKNNSKYNDEMDDLFDKFEAKWKSKNAWEDQSKYPVVYFQDLNALIEEWFDNYEHFYQTLNTNKWEFKKFISDNNFDKLPVYIRFINTSVDRNKINYKQRKIIHETVSDHDEKHFGNGSYQYDDLHQKGQIKLDLLPLEIWSKKYQDDEDRPKLISHKIFRLQLFLPSEIKNINQHIIRAIN